MEVNRELKPEVRRLKKEAAQGEESVYLNNQHLGF